MGAKQRLAAFGGGGLALGLLITFLVFGPRLVRTLRLRFEEDTPATVVLVLVDDLRRDALSRFGDALPSMGPEFRGVRVPQAFTTSTGTNPAIASMLTGRNVASHGLRSVREPGRHRLPAELVTVAERLAEEGFATLASVSLRQLEGRLSGLDQGFDTYIDANLPADGSPLAGDEVVDRLLGQLTGVPAEQDLFAMLHLGDLRALDEPDLFHLLAALEHDDTDYGAVLGGDVPFPPTNQAGLEEVQRRLERRRGDPAWESWAHTRYGARLRELDEHLERLFDGLRQMGRFEDATILVVGTRGKLLGSSLSSDPNDAFPPELIEVPVVLRSPGGRRSAVRTEAVATLRVQATVLSSALDPSYQRGSLWDPDPIFGNLLGSQSTSVSFHMNVVAHVDAPWTRTSAQVQDDGNVRVLEDHEDAAGHLLESYMIRPGGRSWTFSYRPATNASLTALTVPELPLEVELETPYAIGLQEDGVPSVFGPSVTIVSGSLTDDAGPRSRLAFSFVPGSDPQPFDLARPDDTLVLGVESEGQALDGHRLVWFDGEGELLPSIPYLHDPSAPVWSERDGEPWVDVVRADGRWLEVIVRGGDGASTGAARVYAARYPDPDGFESLELRLDESARRISPRALPGAAVVEGELPLTVGLEPGANRRLALAVEVGGEFVPAARMRYLGRRLCGDRLTFLLPFWLPGRDDWFVGKGEEPVPRTAEGGPDDPGEDSGRPSLRIKLERPARAVLVDEPLGLEPDDLAFLRRLHRNE